MSDSVRPHRRQPTRLPRPWDSPGKNTGVGCHFLLQCMEVKSEREVAQLCSTLATPWTAAHQAPPSMGFSRQEYWSGVPLNLSAHIVWWLHFISYRVQKFYACGCTPNAQYYLFYINPVLLSTSVLHSYFQNILF